MCPEDPSGTGDPVVSRVFEIPVPPTAGNVLSSTTVIVPSNPGSEHHMTRGHAHALRDRAEIRVGLAGEGWLVLANESGRHVVEPVRRGIVSYVPSGWAHRIVNLGEVRLVSFATRFRV